MDGASSGSQEGPESQLLLGATHASLIFAKRSAGKIRPEPAGLQGWWGAGYAVGVRVVWHFFKNPFCAISTFGILLMLFYYFKNPSRRGGGGKGPTMDPGARPEEAGLSPVACDRRAVTAHPRREVGELEASAERDAGGLLSPAARRGLAAVTLGRGCSNRAHQGVWGAELSSPLWDNVGHAAGEPRRRWRLGGGLPGRTRLRHACEG